MQQPVPSHRVIPSARPADPPPAPTGTELVQRPDPGLARGKWEAPAWIFWTILAVVVLGSAAYVLFRMGLLKKRKKTPDLPPPSSRMGGRR